MHWREAPRDKLINNQLSAIIYMVMHKRLTEHAASMTGKGSILYEMLRRGRIRDRASHAAQNIQQKKAVCRTDE